MNSRTKSPSYWQWNQDFQYNFFLILNHQHLTNRNYQARFLRNMSRFIGSVSYFQCRDYHMKKMSKFVEQKDVVYYFYQVHYRDRLVEVSHLKKEIEKCLKEKVQDNVISETEAKYYHEKLEKVLDELRFEEQHPIEFKRLFPNRNQNIESSTSVLEVPAETSSNFLDL